MSKTPEWFEMTSGAQNPEPKQRKKPKISALKVAFVAIPLILVGGALVASEGGADDDAPQGISTLSPSTSSANTQSESADNQNGNSSAQSASEKSGTITQAAIQAPSGVDASNKPGIRKPTGDGEEHGEFGEHGEHREHGEFGEHEEHGEFGEDD